MIHVGLNIYVCCKLQRAYGGKVFRWEEWKTVFKGAEAVKNVQAKNNARCATKAMDTAKQIYNSLQAQAKRKIAARRMLKQLKRIGDCGWQPEQKNRRKRGIEQAFPF